MSELRRLVDAVREADAAAQAIVDAGARGESDGTAQPWLDAVDASTEARCELADALLAHPEWVDGIDALAEWSEVRHDRRPGRVEADAYRRVVDAADRLRASAGGGGT